MKTKIFIATLALTLFCIYAGFAQDALGQGLDNATRSLTSNISKIRNLLYAISAIIALFGAVKVYSKFQNQDQDTSKAAAVYGFAFVFFFTAGYIVDAVFINNI